MSAEKTIKKERRMSWHTDKRFMIGLLVVVIPTLFVSIWNATFLLRTLNTTPSLVEKVNKLEFQMSEQGRVNQAILDELKDAKKERKEARAERKEFLEEQARRTPMVNYIERKMGKN